MLEMIGIAEDTANTIELLDDDKTLLCWFDESTSELNWVVLFENEQNAQNEQKDQDERNEQEGEQV